MLSRIGNCTIGMHASILTDAHDEAEKLESVGLSGSGADPRCKASRKGENVLPKYIRVEVESLRAECITSCPFKRVEG